MEADDDSDVGSEPDIEDVDDSEEQALADVSVPDSPQVSELPPLIEVTLDMINHRSPPVAKVGETVSIVSQVPSELSLMWDVDALEVHGSPRQIADAIGTCNVRVKATPER